MDAAELFKTTQKQTTSKSKMSMCNNVHINSYEKIVFSFYTMLQMSACVLCLNSFCVRVWMCGRLTGGTSAVTT